MADIGQLTLDPALAAVCGAIAGAIIGSFLATLVVRWPQERSVAQGRSTCDGCARTLGALDLVPLLSWLAMRGRCRSCGAAIDPVHPLTEAIAALIGSVALYLSPGLSGVALALLGWLLLPLAMLDARHFWLPHRLSWILTLTGLALGGLAMRGIGLDVSAIDRAIGAAAGFAGLWLIAAVYRRVRGRDGLGGGDAPMLAGIGAWIGWTALPFVLFFAAIAGLGIALLRRANGERTAEMRLPLGTLLALALPPAIIVTAAVQPSLF